MMKSDREPVQSSPGVSFDILSVVRLVFRRWRVTVPAMALTILGLIAAVALSPPTYQASGSVALLNPPSPPPATSAAETATTVDAENPYARFGDLSVVVDIIARTMSGQTMEASLKDLGVSDYDVSASANFARGPIIEVTAREASAEAAIRSSQVVLDEAQTTLRQRQLDQGVNPEYLITVDAVEVPSEAAALYGSTIRSAIGVLAAGCLLTLGLAVLAETIAKPRRSTAIDVMPQPVWVDPSPSERRMNGHPVSGARRRSVLRFTPRKGRVEATVQPALDDHSDD